MSDSSSPKLELRLPKGTKDYAGRDYLKMEFLKNVTRKIFALNLGEYLETPTFELTSILTNKYGEDEKLIYNLESSKVGDENGDENDMELKESMFKEQLSLRYDLTVPLVRYCIMNRIDKMRRCSIGKVYRRETTSASNKRLREFYQADFDFVGDFGELVPEISIFTMIQDLFRALNYEEYEIIYNYRQILNLCVENAGIPQDAFATVCSSIDKLDKKEESYVRAELEDKGLNRNQIQKLFEAIGDLEVIPDGVKVLDDKFRLCLSSMSNIDISKIRYDRTLARGSDYYTGIIFEVKFTNSEFTSSVAGGGRYDELIPSYLPPKKKSRKQRKAEQAGKPVPKEVFPMIGFSFGLDRLLSLVTDDMIETVEKRPVWVATIGNAFTNQDKEPIDPMIAKLKIVSVLQKSGIPVLYTLQNRKFNKEIQDAEKANCSYTIIVGEAEYANQKFKIKEMDERIETEYGLNQIDKVIELF